MIRICESCGQEFEGGARTLRCPSCKAKRRKESQKRYKESRRKKTGRAVKIDDTQCRTCEYGKKGIYVCRNQYMCDYWGITGQLRRCEPSPNCVKYKPRKRGKRE